MRIQIKPISINQAFQGRRFKTDKCKSFEKELMLKLPPLKIEFKGALKVNLNYGFSSKLADIDNPNKIVIDVLQKKYGFDDRQIFELNQKKEIVPKGSEYIELQIKQINLKKGGEGFHCSCT